MNSSRENYWAGTQTPPAGSTGLSPPPTNRLWLDLPGGGTKPRKIVSEKNVHGNSSMASYSQQQMMQPQVVQETLQQKNDYGQDKIQQIGHSSTRMSPQKSAQSSPIRALVKSRDSFDPDTLASLQVQERVLEQINMRTADRSQQARMLLDIFRSCQPDEFGLINVAGFHRRFGRLFNLSSAESARLFRIGDPDNLQELDYARFRNCFVPIDTDKDALKCDTFRPSMRMVKAHTGESGAGQGAAKNQKTANTQGKSEHSVVQGMPKHKRNRYLMHKRIQVIIEQQGPALELCFRTREDSRHRASSSIFSNPCLLTSETLVRTKLTFSQLEAAFRKLGMNMAGINPEVLQEMFGRSNQNEELGKSTYGETPRIGYSELIRASDRYFALLGQTEGEIEERIKYGKMHDMYGRKLGRRAVGSGPAAAGHLSQPGFLAHDDGRLGIASPDAVDAHMKSTRSRHMHAMHSSSSAHQLNSSISSHEHDHDSHSSRREQVNISNSSVRSSRTMHVSPSVGSLQKKSPAQLVPSYPSTSPWDGPAAGVSSKPNSMNTINFEMTSSGVPPRYDQAFANDPKKHLWESRWLEKKLPNQKRHLAQKALLGNNEIVQKQNHNMSMRLSFDANYGYEEQRKQLVERQGAHPRREPGLSRYWG